MKWYSIPPHSGHCNWTGVSGQSALVSWVYVQPVPEWQLVAAHCLKKLGDGNTTFLNPGKGIPSDPKLQHKHQLVLLQVRQNSRPELRCMFLDQSYIMIPPSFGRVPYRTSAEWQGPLASLLPRHWIFIQNKLLWAFVPSVAGRVQFTRNITKTTKNIEKLEKPWADTVEMSSIHVCKPKAMMSYTSPSAFLAKRDTMPLGCYICDCSCVFAKNQAIVRQVHCLLVQIVSVRLLSQAFNNIFCLGTS